ncbi:alpha-amylase family glycosyl hydrolase [Actinoplanes sp. NPDC051633]|uniref:alpha-amylase family glycosyl hydrolase n=1 Tax=Actinoplanes sp. NPDC051633 TaxID=3155670 RepID=UPI00341DC0F8
MRIRRGLSVLLSVVLGGGVIASPAQAHDGGLGGRHSLRAPVTDENFYFVMADRFDNGDTANDRGGLGDDPLVSGFDPVKKGFYNGGDLKGLLRRIDYVQGLGTTSIWLTPSFKNKAVQLEDGPSAGYHGYWITDFTQIDPHLGTNEDLRALIEAAHQRGMKVYFDIITNHTADVIGYEEGARQPYVSKDVEPYRTAAGRPFDDRDYAGTGSFPPLDPAVSFPYTPVLDPAERDLKVPAWLNDVTLYHNRGDTTFVGENSLYGDFFGLDDLFTENPRVVRGMTDVYKTWISDFGVDGFRIDTMKHVNDEFWQQFGPEILRYARAHGKKEFFMFGEVFDTTKSFTSHFTTTDRMQAVLDFPFQEAARNYASRGQAADTLGRFFVDDDWYTDADSNVYQLPTFLGNHDMGRIGGFVQADNPAAGEDELVARDRLAHELMYFSRGNPVIYYGDEQGFTGPGGDQDARQTMFASRVPEYLDDDLLGTTATHAQDNFVTTHPLYRTIGDLAALTKQHPALRDGAHQHRYADTAAGVYAFSRIGRHQQREYVVALNNSETAKTATIPTYVGDGDFRRVYGAAPDRLRTDAGRGLTVSVPPLSTVVYQAARRIPASKAAPAVSLAAPAPAAATPSRMQVTADVAGSSFNEVTFYAKTGRGGWTPIGTDDTAPYRVFHDVSGLPTGKSVQYRAVVLDNAGHTRASQPRQTRVPPPALTIEAPAESSNVRGKVEVRAVADPERATHVVRFERSIDGGRWTTIGRDASSPAYTVFDDLAPLNLAAGAQIRYRAILAQPDGTRVTSAVRTVRYAGPQLPAATLRYYRPAGDYDGWGLHLWGDGIDPAVLAQVAWDKPLPPTRIANGWAEFEIRLIDDTKPVNFIVHQPSGDTVPTTREPGGDRSFLPIDHPQVWIVQGDPTVHTSPPGQ